MQDNVALHAQDIVKSYGGVLALNRVSFQAYAGCVNVLIGENGAGKSTLMRILAGVERPDSGSIFLDQQPVAPQSPAEASALGIQIVHQELSILQNLSVADNILVSREITRFGFIQERSQQSGARSALAHLHASVGLRDDLEHAPVGHKQLVELARATARQAKVLILDEPTSALSQLEASELFRVIGELKSAGVAIIYISHRLNELLLLGDYFTVFRSGEVTGRCTRAEVSRAWIVDRMCGTRRDYVAQSPAHAPEAAPETLRLDSVSDAAGNSPRDIDLHARKGEIVGLYGVLGSGRTELLECIAGLRSFTGGIAVNGRLRTGNDVRDAIAQGIALVPEDRQRDGLVPGMSILENLLLSARGSFVLHAAQEKPYVHALLQKLGVSAADAAAPVSSLSGGNQQKVLIGRCLVTSPSILLLDEPTRGVDVHAKAQIYELLRSLAGHGMTILFASSEVEEVVALAHRAYVLRSGMLAAELEGAALNETALFAVASPPVTAISSQTGVSL